MTHQWKKHGLALAVAMVSLMLAACQKNASDSASVGQPEPEVGVVTLAPQPVSLVADLPGRTRPYLVAEVRPQVGGILQKRLFEEGSQVEAGQPLYQIDPALYRATLARAEASLESARLLSERYARLIERNAISRQDHDDARSQYLQARATAETARIDLSYTRMAAPIAGRIGRSSVTQGALVTANQAEALATVQQLDPIYVDIVQPATAILALKEDLARRDTADMEQAQAEVNLTLENGKPYPHTGVLKFSEVSVDEGTGAVTLRAVFPNPEHLLLPGMFVHAQLPQERREAALLVPQRGIARDVAGQASALVVDAEGKVEQRPVVVGRSMGASWLIESGLQAGDRVIVDGLQKVRPGMQVSVVPADGAKQPQQAGAERQQPATEPQQFAVGAR